jgi:predicted chitinase
MVILNEVLVKRQKITDKQRAKLNELYSEMIDENIKKTGPYYAQKMKDLEFQLQENWNFDLNPLCHTWWNKFDNCSCPKMDNAERLEHEKIINCRYPLHGGM